MNDWGLMDELMKSHYRNKEGKEINIQELEPLLRDDDYRVVAQDKIGPYFISTVWMGIPHGSAEPYDFFETMIFLSVPGIEDPREELGKTLDCERYHCYEEALMGHFEMVEKWKNKGNNVE